MSIKQSEQLTERERAQADYLANAIAREIYIPIFVLIVCVLTVALLYFLTNGTKKTNAKAIPAAVHPVESQWAYPVEIQSENSVEYHFPNLPLMPDNKQLTDEK